MFAQRELRAGVPGVVRWWHWITPIDAVGRVRQSDEVRPNGGEPPEVLVSGRGRSLLLWRMGAGAPRSVDDDNRDRLGLPDWLRRLAGSDGPVLVSTSEPEAAMGVVTPDAVLDVMVDELVGEVR